MNGPGASPPRHVWPVQDAGTVPRMLGGPVVVRRTGSADPVGQAPAATGESLCRHAERWGPRPRGGCWLVDAAASARLSGCGGGHFPAARKWRAALSRPGRVVVVVNAAESEPLSAKDATLLRRRPHLVLDGLVTLAEVLRADSGLLWLHDDDAGTRQAVGEAIRERRRAGLDEPPVSVRAVASGYLSGESSAIRHGLDGGPIRPRFQGLPSASEAAGRTVVVHNVETLARVSLLSRKVTSGGHAGARSSPLDTSGSRLLTVLTPSDRRVVEVPHETTIAEAVVGATGHHPPRSAAVLLAGFGGWWAPWSDVAGLQVDESHLRSRGLSLGPGIVAPLWEVGCGVAVTAAITAYLARASARQCGPCLFGLPALADSLARLGEGSARRSELVRLRRDLDVVDGRGACHHPDGAVRLVRSALTVFRDDVAAHAAGRPCHGRGDLVPVPEE